MSGTIRRKGVAVQITNEWRKSTKSLNNPDCVEVRRSPESGLIEVRNSNSPEAGSVSFNDREWLAFTGGVEAGEFEV